MSLALVPGAVSLVVTGVAGLGVPALVGRIPEPPTAEPSDDPAPTKERYADLARLPGLAWKAALVAALAGGATGLRLGWDWHLLVLLPLVPVGVALAVVDWRTRLLPKRLVAPSYVVVVAAVLVVFATTRDGDDLVRAGLGWLVYGGLFWAMWWIHPVGLGYGDVRLAGVLGIALGNLGWGSLLLGMWSASFLCGVLGLVLIRLGVVERTRNPFGPYLVLGALIGVLLGDSLLTL